MKRFLTIAIFVLFGGVASAQNVHHHNDFGHSIYDELGKSDFSYGRPAVTTTVEMFRPDSWGSTFFFIDFDYSSGAKGAYWEIAR